MKKTLKSFFAILICLAVATLVFTSCGGTREGEITKASREETEPASEEATGISETEAVTEESTTEQPSETETTVEETKVENTFVNDYSENGEFVLGIKEIDSDGYPVTYRKFLYDEMDNPQYNTLTYYERDPAYDSGVKPIRKETYFKGLDKSEGYGVLDDYSVFEYNADGTVKVSDYDADGNLTGYSIRSGFRDDGFFRSESYDPDGNFLSEGLFDDEGFYMDEDGNIYP